MKIRLLILSAFITLFSATSLISPFQAVYAESDEETILSSDFEDGSAENWSVFGGGNLSVDTEIAHSGNASLKITDRGGTYHGPSFNCDSLFVSGETYNFDGWVYNDSDTTSTFMWTIKYVDSSGETSYAQIKGAEAVPKEWTELSNTLVIPEDTVSYMVYFESTDPDASFNIDDIVITGKSNVAVEPTTKYVDYQDKYLFDFESDTDIWSPRGDVKILHTDESCNTGSYSIYLTGRTATWNGATVSTSDKVQKGEEYYYSVYVMYNGAEYEPTHNFRLETEYIVDGSVSYNLISEQEVKKGKWTKIEGYYTVPQGAEVMAMYIQTANVEEGQELTENDTMSFYVDTAYITKGSLMKKSKAIGLIADIAIAIAIIAILIFAIIKIVGTVRKNKLALKLVSLDAMTKVLNRNSYEKKIQELENDTEQCQKLYYALCDVNFLKYINDNYGHEKGDEAIMRCAKMLSDATGTDCKVYRTGGDEFVCISRVPIEDNIKNAIKAESAVDMGYPFAVACGFAVYDEEKYSDIKAIIAQCDKEMYTDKQRIKAENQEFSRK